MYKIILIKQPKNLSTVRMNMFTAINDAMKIALQTDETAVLNL